MAAPIENAGLPALEAIADALRHLRLLPGANVVWGAAAIASVIPGAAVKVDALNIVSSPGFETLRARKPVAQPPRATAKQAAEQLDAFRNALRKLLSAADAFGKPALEAINEAKFARGLTWHPPHSEWSLMHREIGEFFHSQYPHLADCAKDAAAALRARSEERGRPSEEFPALLADVAAGVYQTLTGKPPGRSSAPSPFSRFLKALYVIARIKRNSVESDAQAAAVRWRNRD